MERRKAVAEQVRKQSIILQSGLKRKIISILLIMVLFGIAGICLWISEQEVYIPPAFESNVVEGVPEPDEHFMYGTMETDYGYTFSMATNVYQQEDRNVYVYLTNYEYNNVNMMCEIVNKNTGETYYKSGVIKPGKYVEKLLPNMEFPNEAFDAQIMIYAFEEGSWYSGGTVEITATVQAW